MKNPSAEENNLVKNARTALSLMTEHGINPTPVNYAVWYHYAASDRKGLNEELNGFLKKRPAKITDDVTIYLYNKYVQVSAKTEEKQISETSQNTQTVLAEIMEVIDRFSGDTRTYNQQIDNHVSRLSEKIADPALQGMAKELVSRAVAMRASGTVLSDRLEESRKEVEELKASLVKVTTESHRDFLTGAGNRKALEAKLEELASWAKQTGGDLCMIMLDIDYFKKFNDRHGHLLGDEVLKKVAHAIIDTVKGKDFVGRYGGEEFAVLLPKTPLAGGLIVAESIRKNIAESELVRKDTGENLGAISVSAGVARFRPEADSIAQLIGRADDALYRSKMGGRNRVSQESFT